MGGNTIGSNKGSSSVTYGNSRQSNPYYISSTNQGGITNVSFTPGSAGETAYNFVNEHIAELLDSYLNPSLDTPVNQAKLNQFNKQQHQNLQNNIIAPLAQNNMIRSSQASNMYNNLSNQAADYANELIADNQSDVWDMINNLMNLYMSGYEGAARQQEASIEASTGNSETKTTGRYKAIAV